MLLEFFSAAENMGEGMSSTTHWGQQLAGLPPTDSCAKAESQHHSVWQQAKPGWLFSYAMEQSYKTQEENRFLFFSKKKE